MGLPPHTPLLGKGKEEMRAPAEGNTRLIGGQNVLSLHPNAEAVESVKPVHAAGKRFARKHMLAQSLPAARTFFPHYSLIII